MTAAPDVVHNDIVEAVQDQIPAAAGADRRAST